MVRTIWRFARWPLGFALVAALGLGGLFWVAKSKFNPSAPAKDYTKPATALEAQRQDLDYFRKLVATDRSYAPEARTQANRRIDELAASGTVLNRAQLRAALMGIAAIADNGHTSVYSNENPNGRSRLYPIRMSPFSDGIHVMRTEKANADLLGARVVAIDGKPVEAAMRALMTLRGGTEAWRRNYAVLFLGASEILYGAGAAASPEHATWTFRKPDGSTVERELTAYQPEYKEALPDPWRWMSPEPAADDAHDWAVAKPRATPLPLADADKLFRRTWIGKSCVYYLQLKANEGSDKEDIGEFLEAAEKEMRGRRPCNLIMDMRYNGGGDYTNTAGFAGRVPGLIDPNGHIYMLTGVNTFSAGITTVVFVKQAIPPSQFTLLGEPVGDRMVFWAEGSSGCLPNAPFCFHYSSGKHDYVNGCTEWDECYWINRIYPARTPNLAPDETITLSYEDWLAGRDPVFERAAELAKAK